MGDNDQVVAQAARWLAEGERVALATVVGTWGSSPRPAGSLLAVTARRAFVGSVSGGCVEGAVIAEAQRVLADGKPRLLDFGVSDDQAWEVGLACGGEMKVFIQAAPAAEVFDRLVSERPLALATHLTSGAHALVGPATVSGDLGLDAASLDGVRHALREDRCLMIDRDDGQVFVNALNRPLRMVVVGAVHIAQALAPMAALAGFQVWVVDPRRAFATDARFPGVALSTSWPDQALGEIGLDSRSAVVTLTHDPKLDDPALIAALASDAFYVGALGSRKTHARRLARLSEAGVSESALARVQSPVGLPLGGRRASEIAVAILAAAVAACYGRSLRE